MTVQASNCDDPKGTVVWVTTNSTPGSEAGYFYAPTYNVTSIKTSTYTAAIMDLVRVSVTSGNVTINLPNGHEAGDRIAIKMVTLANTHKIIVDPYSTQTIDGATILDMALDHEWAVLISDGTNWMQAG